jgi:2-succinyl-6-hydroxy-2,4-cyclohexadiene-1-carboxylate synthase
MRTVLLHGFTGYARSFSHLGLDAVTPDLPGHNGAPPATSWEDALDRLEPLLDPGPVILGGYSMGARLALGLALRRPERIARLVLASATAGIEGDEERARRRADDEELARFVEQRGVPAFIERWERNPILASLTPVQMQQLRLERLQHEAAGLASALRHLGPGAQPSYWSELHRLQVPVTLLAGRRDTKFTALAERLHLALPRPELRLLECGHVVHVEQPEAFTGALR